MANQAFAGVRGSATAAGDKVCNLRKWSATLLVKVGKYVSNCTGGAHGAVVGAEDSNGTIEVALEHDGGLPFVPGDGVSLVLDVGGAEGVTPGTNKITVPAVIKDMKIDIDLESESPVGAVYSWEGNGPAVLAGVLVAGAGNCCGATPP